jgi:hypothetical protein
VGVTVGLKFVDLLDHHPQLKDFEVTTGKDGDFHLAHLLPETDFWVYAEVGKPQGHGAVIPMPVRTGEDGATFDVGELHVQKGRTLAGRVKFADGKAPPDNAVLIASSERASGILERKLDESGRFEFKGLPDGTVSVTLLFPGTSAPARYCFSQKNKCREPHMSVRLTGQLNHDILDLTILVEPTNQSVWRLRLVGDADVIADFNDAKAGPITGVPPRP